MNAARRVLAHKSKSFALAARLLPASCRDDVAVLYAWCRRADDSVDLGDPATAGARVAELRRELRSIYRGEPQADALAEAFRELVVRYDIPERYPSALLDGMEMDQGAVRIEDLNQLLLYSYRVAGVVGLMMCKVLGVRDASAYRHATHLGIGMQLTNVCRDVVEDFARGRSYLPQQMLKAAGAELVGPLSGEFPDAVRPAARRVVANLLAIANDYYRSGDQGLPALAPRAALAVRTARLVYAAIGGVIARRDHDVFVGRAVVGTGHKLWLVARAVLAELGGRLLLLARLRAPRPQPTTAPSRGETDAAFLLDS